MTKAIETIKAPRVLLLKIIDGLSIEQLNRVPAGFNNNIVWNIGNLIATHQSICYKRCGLALTVDEKFFDAYKPDSRPGEFADETEFDEMKTLLFTTLEQFDADYNNHIFTNFRTLKTPYGVELNDIDDAIHFLPLHEGLHIGCIIVLKKLVQ